METALINPEEPNDPKYQQVHKDGTALEAQAQQIEIVDAATHALAGELLLDVNRKIKIVEPVLEEPVAEVRGTLEKLRAWRDRHLKPFYGAKQLLAAKIGAYDMEQRRKREAEARRLAEKARLEAEEKRRQEIAQAKKDGDREAARALSQAPLQVNIPLPKTPEPASASGVSVSYVWDFQVTDENKIPRKYLIPDLKAIDKIVRALGEKHGIPGIAVFQKPITRGRAA